MDLDSRDAEPRCIGHEPRRICRINGRVCCCQALFQLGDAAKAFLTAKGVTPEMADTLGVIGQSPDLLEALQDPDVRALMQDPNHLRLVAGMLKQAGAQARAMRSTNAQLPLSKAS